MGFLIQSKTKAFHSVFSWAAKPQCCELMQMFSQVRYLNVSAAKAGHLLVKEHPTQLLFISALKWNNLSLAIHSHINIRYVVLL